jgi:MFS family permease
MVAGMFLCRATLDKYVRRMENKQAMKPEQRLVPMVIGCLGMPIGLVWYGWTVEYHVYPAAPIIALAFCGFSIVATIIPSFSYLVHAFGMYAASAIAATITLRCIVGVTLPLAAPALYGKLGLGWGNSLLALIALAFLPVPLVLLKKGEQFRARSRLQIVQN